MTTTRVRPLRADVREQIVAAAGEEFAERGYAGTSVAQVAARAGFTKGAVYSNFGGKPELFAAAMQAYFTEAVVGAFADALGAAAAVTDRPPARAMAHALAENVLLGERWPTLLGEFRSVVAAEPALRDLYSDLRVAQRAQLVEALRRAGEQVALRPDLDLEVAATLLLTCVHGLSVERLAAPDAIPTALVEGLFAHVLEGILA
ncbi:TetR/AcrR family transcriptional regulator [Microlunatus spumicola]|uniref:TetR/AcrR family transcriptional regulator n=1 Tax=Microlunatus spumicola TaxID=81499 RepID=A0ABP6XDA5_9ACTN